MYGVAPVLLVVQTAPASYRVCMLTLALACQELPMSSRMLEQKFLMQMHSQET